MTRDEAVQKLAKAGRLSVAHAEDLYDSIIPKPVIPRYIADYIEKVKSEGNLTVVGAVNEAPDGEIKDWLFAERVNTFAQSWVNGYEVEKEHRYTVKLKNQEGYEDYLVKTYQNEYRFCKIFYTNRRIHTREELESNGFGWVFNCEGIEVEEVE